MSQGRRLAIRPMAFTPMPAGSAHPAAAEARPNELRPAAAPAAGVVVTQGSI